MTLSSARSAPPIGRRRLARDRRYLAELAPLDPIAMTPRSGSIGGC